MSLGKVYMIVLVLFWKLFSKYEITSKNVFSKGMGATPGRLLCKVYISSVRSHVHQCLPHTPDSQIFISTPCCALEFPNSMTVEGPLTSGGS